MSSIFENDLVLLEDIEHGLPDLAGLLAGVNAGPDAGLLVVTGDGSSLLVVSSKTLLESIGVIVGTVDEGLASDIILHLLLGRAEDGVI